MTTNGIVVGNLKRLEMFRNDPSHRNKLKTISNALQVGLRAEGFNLGVTNSPVTPLFLEGGLFEATNLTIELRETYGIFCSIVVYPVIPKDTIMLRLIPTASHTLEDVEYSIKVFKKIKLKLDNKEYATDKVVFS